MKASKLAIVAAAMGMLVLILDSRTAVQAAAAGVDLCIRTVVPSLFPFFLLSGYLTGNLRGGKWIAKRFHCPESCGTILLSGFLGGYPIGARLATREYREGHITKEQADRLIMFCSQAGPSFLFGIVAGQTENIRFVWLLWSIQIISALSVAWLVPGDASGQHRSTDSHKISLTESMKGAINAMASVCGWVIVFSVLMSFLKRWFLWFFPDAIQALLCGALELTNGCLMLSSLDSTRLRFLLAAILLNFGGLCVLMQTASVSAGLSIRRYFLGKILQTCFSVFYTLTLLGLPLAILPVLCVFTLRKFPVFRKNSSNPFKIGV